MQFKHRRDTKLFSMLHPALIMIVADLVNYAKLKHDVELVITQTISNSWIDKKLKRTSDAHAQGRACDIRTKNLDAFVLQDLINYINKKDAYKKYHYMSRSGMKRLAYYHIGNAEHLHLAIHKKFTPSKK